MSYRFVDRFRAAAAGSGWNCSSILMQSHPDPAARKLSTNLYDIYHCCVYSEELLMKFHPDPAAARKLSTNLYDIYHCCVYNEGLLMMDRGTVRNM
jgi:hypothetical protein